jgi:hypothetical protein
MMKEELNPYIQMRPKRQAPRFPMPELDEIDWGKFEDAYGPATAVPEFLRALSSPDPKDRAWAIEALEACIHHQGSVYSGSEKAVPFLVQLAGTNDIEDRELILKLLAGLAVHAPDACIVQGAYQYQSSAYKTVCEHGESFVKLLSDPKTEVITGAAFVLCFLDQVPKGAMEALTAALEKSTDPVSKSHIVMAIGYVSRYLKSNTERDRIAGYLNDSSPEVQLGACIALAQIEGEGLGDDARKVLKELYNCKPLVIKAYFWPWYKEDLSQIAGIILGAVTTNEQLMEDMDDEFLSDEERKSAGLKCLYRMLRADRDRLHEMVLPSELDENQLKLLKWYVENLGDERYDCEFFEYQGLPDSLKQLKRLICMDKGGCDQTIVIDSREVPAWFGIRETLEGRIKKQELIKAINKLDAGSVYQLIDDALYGPWALLKRRGFYPYGEPEKQKVYDDYVDEAIRLMSDIAIFSGEPGLKWANDVAEKESAKGEKRKVKAGIVATIILGENTKKNNTELPEICDRLLALDQTPANTHLGALIYAYKYLSPKRREALLSDIRLFYYEAYEDPKGTVYRWNNNNRGWSFLMLMDREKAAGLVIDTWLEWARHLREEGNYDKYVGGKVSSTLRQRVPEDQKFPEKDAISVLVDGGENIIKKLEELCNNPETGDCHLFEEALKKINN